MLLAVVSVVYCKTMEAIVQTFSCCVALTLIVVSPYIELKLITVKGLQT
jgi:hypothetical protein